MPCAAAAVPVVVATAKATVAVLLDPAGAITVSGAAETNDAGQCPGNINDMTASTGTLLSVILAGLPVGEETME
jgi:hypothetical protein